MDSRLENPMTYFHFFCPPALLDEIANQTNMYARSQMEEHAERNRKPSLNIWQATDKEELTVFLGLVLGMSIEPRKGGFRQYWRKDTEGTLVGPNYGRFMGLKRFTHLRRFLHFSDNTTDVPRDDPC